MSGSEADRIARSLDDEIVRDRLIDALDDRWSHTLTLLTAPGGYGKTRALAQAVHSNREDVDVYLRLRPSHGDPTSLLAALLGAVGVVPAPTLGPDELLSRLVDHLAASSPTRTCLIIDDAHLIAGTPAVDAVAELLRTIPITASLLLSGRREPALPLARLQADDAVAVIGRDVLSFTDAEIDILARHHGTDRDLLASLAGWPALVRLAIVAGKLGPRSFLLQEIAGALAPDLRRGLEVAALAGGADQALFDRCRIDATPHAITVHVPLTDLDEHGTVRPHDLWAEALDLSGIDDYALQLEHVARWHGENRRHDEAIRLAIEAGAEDLARQLLMDALDASDLGVSGSSTMRWLELFGGGQAIPADDAELLLLRGWDARLRHGPGHGDDDVRAALELFADRGDTAGEARAGIEHAYRGFLAGDTGPIADVVKRAKRLAAGGETSLKALGRFTDAIVAELRGDFATARLHSSRALRPGIRPEFAELVLRHRSTLCFLDGDGDAAVNALGELVRFAPSMDNQVLHAIARFANGDVHAVVERWSEIRYHDTGNVRENYIFSAASVFLDACLGITPDLTTVRASVWDRSRERMQLALCEWSASVVAGQEEPANAELGRRVAELGIDDPLVSGEIRRFPVSCYVAVPSARAHLDELEAAGRLGRYHRERLGLARILVGLRNGEAVDWSAHLGAHHTISAMVLPWSVEIACGLVEHDEDRAVDLADALYELTGARTRDILRSLEEQGSTASAGAAHLLRLLPAPPPRPLRVRTQPSVALERDGERREIGRRRVRELLLLLAVRGRVSRDVAMTTLWPDKDIDRARNNLRITLSYLRDELEPDRRSGEPSFHLRQRGDEITLARSPWLTVDVWSMLDGLDAGDAARALEDRAAMLAAWGPVAEMWVPPLLIDLAALPDVGGDVAALSARLRDATLEVAEAHLAMNRNDDADRLGRKLLARDPFDERAHDIVIAAALGLDREGQLRQAIDDCLAALDELGVAPSPSTRMLLRRARYPQDSARRTA